MHLCTMELRFSDDFLKALEFSRDEAVRTGWHNICPDHIMLGVLRHSDNGACHALDVLGVDLAAFKAHIDEAVFCAEQVQWEERGSVNLCDSAQSILQHAALEAARCGDALVEPLHFLLAVSRIAGCYSHDYLDDCRISLRALIEASGRDWSQYGLSPSVMSGEQSPVMPDPIGHLPDPALLAATLEQRLREGYTTDKPHVS